MDDICPNIAIKSLTMSRKDNKAFLKCVVNLGKKKYCEPFSTQKNVFFLINILLALFWTKYIIEIYACRIYVMH